MTRAFALLCLMGCGHIAFDPPGSRDGGSRDGASSDGSDVGNAWQLVQSMASSTNVTTFAAPVRAGSLVVVAVQANSGDTVDVTDDAADTYAYATGSRSINTLGGQEDQLEIWYATNANAGGRTVTANGTSNHATVAWEFAGASATAPFDGAIAATNQAASNAPTPGAITTSHAGDIVIAAAVVDNAITSLASPSAFTEDSLINTNGWAHLTSSSEPAGTYSATWTQPNAGTYCASAAAFTIGP